MTSYVVDACVVVKWFIPEVHTQSAVKLLESENDLFVPDLLYPELGNVIWKKVRKKELDVAIAQEILWGMQKMSLEILSSKPLLSAAFDIADSLDRSVYDSIYLAAACDQDTVLVTADLKFYNAIFRSALKDNILWIEDL